MRKEKGFTLIELMIVVAIIAILAAIALPAFGQQVKKSKDGKAVEMLGTMRSQVSMVQADLGGYAPSSANILSLMTAVGNYTEASVSGEQAKLVPIQGYDRAHTDLTGANKVLKAGTPATGIAWSYNTDGTNDAWNILCNATSDTKNKNWASY